MASRLSHIKIEEVSGVDDPANSNPGWMLRKSSGQSVGEMLVGQLERMGAVKPARPVEPICKSNRQVAEEFLTAWRENAGDEGVLAGLRDDPKLADRLHRMMAGEA